MDVIQLNFINNSNDSNNSKIVIFQQNAAANVGELAVAWKIIQNPEHGADNPFTFPVQNSVAAADSYGNFTSQQPAVNGNQFSVVPGSYGAELKITGTSDSNNQVDVINALQMGAISANIYKDGRLLAAKTGVAPGQKAVFEFKPTIWIGIVSQVEEGDIMNSAILQDLNSQLSLPGIQKANIIMTGGGPGKTSIPYIFTLADVVYA